MSKREKTHANRFATAARRNAGGSQIVEKQKHLKWKTDFKMFIFLWIIVSYFCFVSFIKYFRNKSRYSVEIPLSAKLKSLVNREKNTLNFENEWKSVYFTSGYTFYDLNRRRISIFLVARKPIPSFVSSINVSIFSLVVPSSMFHHSYFRS